LANADQFHSRKIAGVAQGSFMNVAVHGHEREVSCVSGSHFGSTTPVILTAKGIDRDKGKAAATSWATGFAVARPPTSVPK
jgi:hypothetical protein